MRSRSRREEYAKRFEETTRQEIKNYNDSLLSTHMALEEFRGKLKECVDLYAQQVAQLSSQIKSVERENVDLKDEVASLDKKLKSQIYDFNKLERETIESDKKAAHFQKWTKEEIGRQSDAIYSLRDCSHDDAFMVQRRIEDIFQEVGHSYRRTKKDNDKLKEEILSIPSEAKMVREELLKELGISAVNKAGVTREIEKLKKKVFVQKKLGEYFQTQLENLKSKKD